ncbi:3-oxoacyl-ACP synthase [Duganella sp. Leaf61]|uniref:beta-ketoacyl synthase chain length factor n=1 Tax=Duganella sp. Leaf61 TaxID=1736227 RepID=UPI0006F88077|nr:beta-ketoacyl synthase chain length factor [Duganella sp. Leaf61]KQN77748.1 3-oxoacyl-ACP synthase [Duganella sp. Leaf61]
MRNDGVTFSIARHAYWAPGLTTLAAWTQWAQAPVAAPIILGEEPGVKAMPPMLRRRAGFFGKMALEVAYECLDGRTDVPVVFCSRHGEVARAVELLSDLARGEPLSPTAFSMSVHNAHVGLLTIARKDRANHIALAAGGATIEHAVIEACGLLADGAASVLLVACDAPLPELFMPFRDGVEQAHAWAWLLTAPVVEPAAGDPAAGDPAAGDPAAGASAADASVACAPAACASVTLRWVASDDAATVDLPGGLAVARFLLGGAAAMERCDGRLRWHWTRGNGDAGVNAAGA